MRPADLVMGPLLHLKLVSAMRGLGSTTLATIAREMEEMLVREGSPLLAAAEPVEAMYFIVDGRVEIVRGGRRTHEGAGGAAGLLEVLAGEPSGVEVRAISDTVVLRLDGDVARELMELHFSLLLAFLREVAGRVARHPGALERSLVGSRGANGDHGELDRVGRLLALHRSPAFPSSSMDALSEVADHARERRWKEGELLWRPDSPSTSFYVLCSGALEFGPVENGKSLRLGPGAAPGMTSTLGGTPRRWPARTVAPTVGLEIDREGLFDVLEDHFEMATGILSRLAGILLATEGADDYEPGGAP